MGTVGRALERVADAVERAVEVTVSGTLDGVEATASAALGLSYRVGDLLAEGLWHTVGGARGLRDGVVQPLVNRLRTATGLGCFLGARIALWTAGATAWGAWGVLVFGGHVSGGFEAPAIILSCAVSERVWRLDRAIAYFLAWGRDPDDVGEDAEDDLADECPTTPMKASRGPLRWDRFRDDVWNGAVVPMAALVAALLAFVLPHLFPFDGAWTVAPLVAVSLLATAATLLLLTCEDPVPAAA